MTYAEIASPALHDDLANELRQCCGAAAAASGYHGAKGLLDRAVALLLLILASPVIGLLVVAIRLSSRGPAIYSQTRVGRGGKIFVMYKLRSMRCDAEARTGPVWASPAGDPRITPLGYWLRRLHLDELPQLYNVVCGEMALVGPRPERPSIVVVLAREIPGYLERLQVLPGITGLAQINLPPDTDLDSVRAKLVLDREYIREASLALEARIVLCTILRLAGLRGGRAVSLLGLQRNVVLSPTVRAQEVIPVAGTPAEGAVSSPPDGQEADLTPEQGSGVFSQSAVVAGHPYA
jgi:lipopolysaccharide/colanic/teichoic acid biosynthesis glycosyltransferase